MDKIMVLTNAIILLLKSKDPIAEEKVRDLLEHIRNRSFNTPIVSVE